ATGQRSKSVANPQALAFRVVNAVSAFMQQCTLQRSQRFCATLYPLPPLPACCQFAAEIEASVVFQADAGQCCDIRHRRTEVTSLHSAYQGVHISALVTAVAVPHVLSIGDCR